MILIHAPRERDTSMTGLRLSDLSPALAGV